MKKTTTFLVSLFVLLNYQNIKATNVATTPITDANIRTAVNAWVTNRSTAYTTYGHIKEWDVSNVTDMSQLFDNAQDFNDDISGWDVSNVTNMSNMFRAAHKFNQDIRSWDVANVTDMSEMFRGADRFNQDIGSWDVANVTNMYAMFSGADNFNQNLTNWCVSNITTEPRSFSYHTPLTTSNKPVWGTCPVLSVGKTFIFKNISIYKLNSNIIIINGLPKEKTEVAIYTLLGKKVLNTSFTTKDKKEINVHNFSKGVYLVQLINNSGKLTKKIILD